MKPNPAWLGGVVAPAGSGENVAPAGAVGCESGDVVVARGSNDVKSGRDGAVNAGFGTPPVGAAVVLAPNKAAAPRAPVDPEEPEAEGKTKAPVAGPWVPWVLWAAFAEYAAKPPRLSRLPPKSVDFAAVEAAAAVSGKGPLPGRTTTKQNTEKSFVRPIDNGGTIHE